MDQRLILALKSHMTANESSSVGTTWFVSPRASLPCPLLTIPRWSTSPRALPALGVTASKTGTIAALLSRPKRSPGKVLPVRSSSLPLRILARLTEYFPPKLGNVNLMGQRSVVGGAVGSGGFF